MRRLIGWLFLSTFGLAFIWIGISFLIYLPIETVKVHPTVARLNDLESSSVIQFSDWPGQENDFSFTGISTASGTTQMVLHNINSVFFRLSVDEHRISQFSFWAQNLSGREIDNSEYPHTRRQLTRFLERCPGCHPTIIMRISRDPFAVTRTAVRYGVWVVVSQMKFR